jgi:hypothetical protein
MPDKTLRAGMSFEQCRQALLKDVTRKAGANAVEKVVKFQNNDVPSFLKKISEFEEESRKCRLVAK